MADEYQIEDLIRGLDAVISNSKKGLPQEVFFFVSRLTPLVNVDLLIRNENNQVLLTWRRDQFYNGWHIPGGILRFKETFTKRLEAVAQEEFGARIEHGAAALAVNEMFHPHRDVRGHFISFLYSCRLLSPLDESRKCLNPEAPAHGQWWWHTECPRQLIPQHEVYRKYLELPGVAPQG